MNIRVSYFLFLMAILLFQCTDSSKQTIVSAPSSVSLSEAEKMVIKDVLHDSLANKRIYYDENVLQKGMSIYAEDGLLEMTTENDSWFFYVNHLPMAYFPHDVYYVLVDTSTGKVTSKITQWWPKQLDSLVQIDYPEGVTFSEAKKILKEQYLNDNTDRFVIKTIDESLSWGRHFFTVKDDFVVTTPEKSWLFYVDKRPGKRFAHPVSYVFVSRYNGFITVIDGQWWPLEINSMKSVTFE